MNLKSALLTTSCIAAAGLASVGAWFHWRHPDWPAQVRKVKFLSTDGTYQRAMFYKPAAGRKVPLLVGLHTWGGDYRQLSNIEYARWCIDNEWAFISPDFRGPNRRPEATGSDLVVSDIISAVEYAEGQAEVDAGRVYLVGVSGGGYTALMVAAKHPDIWAGVSVWSPIVDLAQWYKFCTENGYANTVRDLERSCGGSPSERVQEYAGRSPITYLRPGLNTRIDIYSGIHDGHAGPVPVWHALSAFNRLAEPDDMISEEDIAYMVENESAPDRLAAGFFGQDIGRRIYFAKGSKNVTVTLFEGGHEILTDAALNRLSKYGK